MRRSCWPAFLLLIAASAHAADKPDPSAEFFKMTAAGNDFILFDGRAGAPPAEGLTDFVRRLCTRALSVGADGVIVIERSSRADIRATFYNPDGGVTFCGNGVQLRGAQLRGGDLVLGAERGVAQLGKRQDSATRRERCHPSLALTSTGRPGQSPDSAPGRS